MKTPAEVRTTAARRFRASCRRWLAGHLGLPDDSAWPFAVPLGVPSEREVLAEMLDKIRVTWEELDD